MAFPPIDYWTSMTDLTEEESGGNNREVYCITNTVGIHDDKEKATQIKGQ